MWRLFDSRRLHQFELKKPLKIKGFFFLISLKLRSPNVLWTHEGQDHGWTSQWPPRRGPTLRRKPPIWSFRRWSSVFLVEIPISDAIRFAEILGSSWMRLRISCCLAESLSPTLLPTFSPTPSRGMGGFFSRRTTNEPFLRYLFANKMNFLYNRVFPYALSLGKRRSWAG